ncbi:MAG TPA: 4-hydroxy-3-methylbut-2-enyl diphosphate reductase [Gemmatimonadota bacterium]|jgi:4-hydroxy-3-methylbut-2-enyl diphosphate reductase
MPHDDPKLVRKGFGLRAEVLPLLAESYHSALVDRLVADGHVLEAGDVTFRLAREFGFCYGVDRAVEYAYETRRKFPERRIFLTGEIIHNPFVNRKLGEMGIDFLSGRYASGLRVEDLTAEDVVLLPAFGVTTDEMAALRARGCVLVDTTCGSVLNVWKRVERYAREGFTAVVHGKWYHEETRATCSRATALGGHYLVVRDMAEARELIAYMLQGGDGAAFTERFREATSAGFDPDRHLRKVGVANQTTMLMSESLAIAEAVGEAIAQRDGGRDGFLSFDTICSATQERQDAILDLLEEPLHLMLVIGGYNSSNTCNLAAIAARRVPTYHIDDPTCLLARDRIRHKPVGAGAAVEEGGWLPYGVVRIGLTAGASTPNNKIGEAIERILELRGIPLPEVPA